MFTIYGHDCHFGFVGPFDQICSLSPWRRDMKFGTMDFAAFVELCFTVKI